MKRRDLVWLGLLVVATMAVGMGCQDTETGEHGHGEHGHTHAPIKGPKSFPEGVEKLKEINDQICAAMESDNPDSAHDALHEVGELLNRLPELAADTDLGESDWNEVEQEVNKLFEAFKEVDVAFHNNGDKKAAYESSKATIDDGVASLETKLALLGDDDGDQEHDDEHGHEHGDGESHDE